MRQLPFQPSRGWDQTSFLIFPHGATASLGVTLTDIHAHYQNLDAVADAWLREVARLNATGSPETIEEAGLTWLCSASVRHRLWDRSEKFGRTTSFIARRLKCADRLMTR